MQHLIAAVVGIVAALVFAGIAWSVRRAAERAAAMDMSSGLFTRGSFVALADRVLPLMTRRRSVCVLLVVRALANTRKAALDIAREVRGSDIVGRLSREDIGLLLPDTEPKGAHVLMKRLAAGGHVELVGIGCCPQDGGTCEALIEAAHAAATPAGGNADQPGA